MFIGVRAIFGANIQLKKALRSSRLVLGYPNPRHHWVQNRVSLHTLSRLKGIEPRRGTKKAEQVSLNPSCSFSFKATLSLVG